MAILTADNKGSNTSKLSNELSLSHWWMEVDSRCWLKWKFSISELLASCVTWLLVWVSWQKSHLESIRTRLVTNSTFCADVNRTWFWRGWVVCLHSLWLPCSWLSCRRCDCRIWKHQQHGQSMRWWAQMMFMSFLWTLSKSTLPRSVLWLLKGWGFVASLSICFAMQWCTISHWWLAIVVEKCHPLAGLIYPWTQ